MGVVYNIPVEATGEYIATAEAAMGYINQAGSPGAFLVDSLPLCATIIISVVVGP